MRYQPPFETAVDFTTGGGRHPRGSSMFEQQFVQQLLVAVRPEIKALIKEVLADQKSQPLIVDYEEAGRMIGTSYEGVRKLVRKGKLTAVSRSGRHRGIAVAELRDYVQRSEVGWSSTFEDESERAS